MRFVSIKVYKGSVLEAELDDGRKLYIHADVAADHGVCAGMELDREKLKAIVYASNFRRAYQRALYLLDYRDYSSAEMREKLIGTYKNEALCSSVVDRLKEHRLIDDARYAGNLARRLTEGKRYGRRRVLRELALKGIDSFTAEDALVPYESVFGENLAELLKEKYSRQLEDREDRKSAEKVKAALVRRGYSFGEIDRAVREYYENAEDNEEEN